MKKVVSLLVCFAVMFSVFCGVSVSADSGLVLTATNEGNLYPGETCKLTITISSLPTVASGHYITSIRFRVKYNDSLVTVITSSGKQIKSVSTFNSELDELNYISSEGVLQFSYFDWDTVDGIVNDKATKNNYFAVGQKVTFEYTVSASASVGTDVDFEIVGVEYTVDETVLTGVSGFGVDFKGKVKEEEKPSVIRGDVNGDGGVNSDDAIYLLRHILIGETYPINQSGDMNGDGKVTSDDAIHLLRFTLAPEIYPLSELS